MGLALETGILSDLKTNDFEGYEYYKSQFEIIYKVLAENGIQFNYKEPEDIKDDLIWSSQMYGYGGLHYLRRLSAHIWDNQSSISPGVENSDEDEILGSYFENLYTEGPFIYSPVSKGWFSKKRKTFDHLLIHSDAEGFYIPVDFDKVILDENISGGFLGSTFRLKEELERLAEWLELDLSIDANSEEVFLLPESHNKSNTKWKKFAIESHSCINLYKACNESIKNKCAITFC